MEGASNDEEEFVQLVAVDGSAASEAAIALAQKLQGTRPNARTLLVFVQQETQTSWFDVTHDKLDKLQNYENEQRANVLKGRFPDLIVLKSTKSLAAEELVEFCKTRRVDLIVVGRSNSAVDRFFLGSNGAYLLHNGNVPVVIAKSPIDGDSDD